MPDVAAYPARGADHDGPPSLTVGPASTPSIEREALLATRRSTAPRHRRRRTDREACADATFRFRPRVVDRSLRHTTRSSPNAPICELQRRG